MVLSINADLQAELERADTRPVYLVEVYPRPYPADSGETVWPNSLVNLYPIRFCWSDSPLVSAPASRSTTIFREQTRIPNIIKTIASFGVTLDPLTRKVSQGDTSIEIIDDGTLRNILSQPGINNVTASTNPNVATFLFGQKVIIKLGVQTYVSNGVRKAFDISNFMTLGTFTIAEVLPKKGSIELSCARFSALPHTKKLSRNFRTRSPHGQLHEILFNEMGFDNTSGTFDESSVDAWYTAQPANDIDKRHWACKREDHDFDSEFLKSSSRVKDEGAWDIINDLSFLTGGFVCERENGKITYVPYVPSAASVRDLTADDVTDFEQVETYGNLNNQTHLKITNTVQKTDWEPSSTGISASQFGTSSVPAYFGGVEGDSVFTSKIADAQQAHRFPDVSSRAIRIAREVTFSSNLKWEGGISSSGFLKPRVVTYGSMIATGETNSNGVAQGPATYNHTTKQVTLTSGKVNTTNPPPTSGATIDTYLSSDFVDVTRGPVLRVISTKTVGGTPTAVTDDGGKSVTFKEGRILSIDNSGSTSVITLADDQLLEFQANWGTSTAFDWVILEPSFPVPVGYYKVNTRLGAFAGPIGLRPNLGIQMLPYPGASGAWYRNAHFQRYFYVQWAAVTGFAGANIQFAGSDDQITLGAPYQKLISPSHIGGPANADKRLPVSNPGSATYLNDLRLLYGHDAASTSATSFASYAQLQGSERTSSLGIAGDAERYAYLKLEYNTTGGNQYEIIKCNAAYPIPLTWNRWANTVSVQHAAYGVNRVTESSYEPDPNQRTAGQPYARRQQQMPSTFAYRAECSSVTVGYTPSPTTQYGTPNNASPVLAWDTNLFPDNVDHAITPSGRGQFGTVPSPMLVPTALLNVPTSQSDANHYLGPRCTDVTCAVDVSQRILNRAAYGMPVIEFATSLAQADLQLGDFISITHPQYLRHAQDGSDTGTIFEITRKEISIEGDSPRIQWQAVWVRQDSAANYTIATNSVLNATIPKPSTANPTEAVIGSDFTIVTDEIGNTIKYDNKLEGVSVVWPGSS
tara:strand:- start:452 stop:3550 length:3099 start_codon:yes stop_codon:yes gene_type:complete